MAYAPPERADRLTPFKHFEKTRDAIGGLWMSWLGVRDGIRNYLTTAA